MIQGWNLEIGFVLICTVLSNVLDVFLMFHGGYISILTVFDRQITAFIDYILLVCFFQNC